MSSEEYEHECEQCGKSFTSESKWDEVCSHACYWAWEEAQPVPPPCICASCRYHQAMKEYATSGVPPSAELIEQYRDWQAWRGTMVEYRPPRRVMEDTLGLFAQRDEDD